MQIYHTGTHGGKAHKKKDCPGLKRANRYVETHISRLGARDLCRLCFPEWPHLRVLHRRCEECAPDQPRPRPCRHNGGICVLVPTPYGHRRSFVWPEHAYRYRLAPEAMPV